MNIHYFLDKWCYASKNFKYVCSGFLCCVCGLSSWLLLWFLICGLVQVLFLSYLVNFYFFNSHFSITALGLDPSSGVYLNKFTASVVPSD